MRKKLAHFFVTAICIIIFAVAAQAETNGSCVSECVQKGGSATSCVPKCTEKTYENPLLPKPKKSTDYRCLTLCVNEGQPAAVCMPQCTFTQSSAQKSSSQPYNPANTVNKHRILETPMPIGEGSILKKETALPTTASNTDFTCVAKCMQQGMQSQICRKRCPGSGPKREIAQ